MLRDQLLHNPPLLYRWGNCGKGGDLAYSGHVAERQLTWAPNVLSEVDLTKLLLMPGTWRRSGSYGSFRMYLRQGVSYGCA